jgi:hypothetical protein
MAPLPHSDTGTFLPHICTAGLRSGSLPSTACSCTRIRPHPVIFPSDCLKLFLDQTFYRINTPIISSLLFFLLAPPMKVEQTECSETSAHKIQTPGNNLYPYKYTNNFIPVILPAYTAYEDGTECSETSAYKIQMPGNSPKERIQQSKSCETRGCHRTLSRIIPGSIFDVSNTCCLADIWYLFRSLMRLCLGFRISSILMKLFFIVLDNSAFYVSLKIIKKGFM